MSLSEKPKLNLGAEIIHHLVGLSAAPVLAVCTAAVKLRPKPHGQEGSIGSTRVLNLISDASRIFCVAILIPTTPCRPLCTIHLPAVVDLS
jgi:hypothetical protein